MKDFLDPLLRDFDLHDKRTHPYFYIEDEHMTFMDPPIPTLREKLLFWGAVAVVVVCGVSTLSFFAAKLLGLI